jgi:energy-coupling factor transporter ATP-binding protein EcfA2
LPAKDAAEFVEQGGTAESIRQLLQRPESSSLAAFAKVDAPAARVEAAPLPADSTLRLEASADGALLASASTREYRIRGLSPNGLDRLRVNLRLKVNGSFHLDTLDLYQARSRSTFAQAAAKQCGVPEAQIGKDLLELVERLEAARIEMSPAGSSSKTTEAPMSAQEREAALAYLKAPNLLERIVEDFRACGLIGERASVLVSYLAAISRKLAKPLSLLIVARTGAGKSSLQDALCSLVPPEEVVRVTRLTGQALFYKDPDSLKNKVLAIAEEEGAAQAVYSLRTLASDQWLSIAATRTDPQTGKLHTEHYEIHGPVAIVITTTSPEAFDEETRSRFVLLTLNESVEQTRAILARQRQSDTLEGVLAEASAEHIHRRHHHVQRLLRPLKVVNPYSKELDYPDEKLIARREQKKYLTLIKSIALLHQYQREIKRAAGGQAEIEYIEVTPEDIRLANELAREVLWQSWDELAPPVRGLKRELEALYQRQAQELKIDPGDVQLTRRQIREATGWSDWQVRVYCQRLVEMEYLVVVTSGNGRPCLYQLVEPGCDDRPQLDGLAEVPTPAIPAAVATGSTAAQQLKKKAGG